MTPAPGGARAGFWRTTRGRVLGAVVGLVLAGHLPFLASATADIDGANFALGFHEFDVALHQPHPPGYPVLIALGRVAAVPFRLLPAAPPEWGGAHAPDVRGLALLSVLGGALALVPLFGVFRRLEGDRGVALSATVLTAAAPLVWFTTLRPLSDMPALAAALAVQALALDAWLAGEAGVEDTTARGTARRRLFVAALIAGLAIGLRLQTAWLTLPVLGAACLARARHEGARVAWTSAGLVAAGVLAWAVPLVLASGGPQALLAAVRWQAGDDLAGVAMLSTRPSWRLVALQLNDTLVRPWASTDLARVALGLTAIGGVVLLVRSRRAVGLLALAFLPYAVLHLFLHETDEVRYAVPLIPLTTYLMARALRAIFGARGLSVATAALVAGQLVVTLPAYASFVRYPPPTYAAIGEIDRQLLLEQNARARISGHQPFQRALQVTEVGLDRRLPMPMFEEQRELVRYWLDGGDGPVLFIRDPRRTDLALVDPASQQVLGRYRWRFRRQRFLGGIRPDQADLLHLDAGPAWFCADGWHLTPETLGRSERRGLPTATAYVRRAFDERLLVFGAERVGPGNGPVQIDVALDGRPVLTRTIDATAPQLVEIITLPPAALDGDGRYARLTARWSAGAGVRARFTHFAVERSDRLFTVFAQGWHEQEYDAGSDRSWRWTSDRAVILLPATGQDLTLRLSGESPLKYFDTPPTVVVRAGDREVGRFRPATDFSEEVSVPAAALTASGGRLTIETDRSFVPAERSASPDRRRLGLRIRDLTIR